MVPVTRDVAAALVEDLGLGDDAEPGEREAPGDLAAPGVEGPFWPAVAAGVALPPLPAAAAGLGFFWKLATKASSLAY